MIELPLPKRDREIAKSQGRVASRDGFSHWVFKNIHQREESRRRREKLGRKMVGKEKMMAVRRTIVARRRGEGWRRRPNNIFLLKKNIYIYIYIYIPARLMKNISSIYFCNYTFYAKSQIFFLMIV